MQVKVIDNKRITPDNAEEEVRHIVLDVAGCAFNFVEGQSVGVLLPGPDEYGNPHHLRLYSVASSRTGENGISDVISLCVKRCFGIDEFSGEKSKGVVSNYLCDTKPGDSLTITGPYGTAFVVPGDNTTNLLMIAMGTGIAPFRAFIRHIFETVGEWKGKIRLFYGAKRGIELLYMNREQDDFTQYYDEKTFKAFEALSPHPALDEPIALEKTLAENADEVWGMIQDPKTYVFIAGLEKVVPMLDKAMSTMAGSDLQWKQKKKELIAANRWFELLY